MLRLILSACKLCTFYLWFLNYVFHTCDNCICGLCPLSGVLNRTQHFRNWIYFSSQVRRCECIFSDEFIRQALMLVTGQCVQDLMFSLWCCWKFKSSGMWWCCVVGRVVHDVLKDHSAFVFSVRQSRKNDSLWGWRSFDRWKCRELLTNWHSITTQKTWNLYTIMSVNLGWLEVKCQSAHITGYGEHPEIQLF